MREQIYLRFLKCINIFIFQIYNSIHSISVIPHINLQNKSILAKNIFLKKQTKKPPNKQTQKTPKTLKLKILFKLKQFLNIVQRAFLFYVTSPALNSTK